MFRISALSRAPRLPANRRLVAARQTRSAAGQVSNGHATARSANSSLQRCGPILLSKPQGAIGPWLLTEQVMINALLLLKMEGWVTDDMKARIQGTSLSNAKQLICGTIRDEVILDVAATTAKDLNVAVGTFAEVQGVKDVTVLKVSAQS